MNERHREYFRKYKILKSNSSEELERKINELMEEVGGGGNTGYVNWRNVKYQYSNGVFTVLIMYDGYK